MRNVGNAKHQKEKPKMKWIKKKISWIQRLRYFKDAFNGLAQIYIDCYDSDRKKWHISRLSWQEKFDCFYSMFEMAIIGFVYEGVSS
jgi:hypothetical protein